MGTSVHLQLYGYNNAKPSFFLSLFIYLYIKERSLNSPLPWPYQDSPQANMSYYGVDF